MSIRLQVIVPDELERRIQKSAQRSRLSKSAYVRRAIERALAEERSAGDALERLSRLEGPTADIEQMLAEIEAGRSGSIFVDSNVPMYVAGRDHPLRDPARRFLGRARSGDVEICTSTEVLQEILYRYTALGHVDLAVSVYDLFTEICPVVLPVTLADTDRARQLLPGPRASAFGMRSMRLSCSTTR